jgi:hypothetical protein
MEDCASYPIFYHTLFGAYNKLIIKGFIPETEMIHTPLNVELIVQDIPDKDNIASAQYLTDMASKRGVVPKLILCGRRVYKPNQPMLPPQMNFTKSDVSTQGENYWPAAKEKGYDQVFDLNVTLFNHELLVAGFLKRVGPVNFLRQKGYEIVDGEKEVAQSHNSPFMEPLFHKVLFTKDAGDAAIVLAESFNATFKSK